MTPEAPPSAERLHELQYVVVERGGETMQGVVQEVNNDDGSIMVRVEGDPDGRLERVDMADSTPIEMSSLAHSQLLLIRESLDDLLKQSQHIPWS